MEFTSTLVQSSPRSANTPGAEVLDHNVGILDQTLEDGDARRALQVEGDPQLEQVFRCRNRPLFSGCGSSPGKGPWRLAGSPRPTLAFDDLGAEAANSLVQYGPAVAWVKIQDP